MAQYASYSGYIGGSGGGGTGNIASINGAVGPAVTIAAGTGISVGTVGNTITVTNTGGAGTVTAVTGTAPVVSSGGTTPDISMHVADTTHDGYLSSTDWNTFNSKQPTIVGTPNTFAGFDGAGALETIPNWAINTLTGGASELITLTPADSVSGQTDIINNFQNTITPTANLVNLSHYNLQNYLYMTSPFNMNFTVGLKNGIEVSDVGDKGNISGIDQGIFLGDGTNVSSSEYVNLNITNLNIRNNHTVNQNVTDYNSNLYVQSGGSVGGITAFNSNLNVQTGGTANYLTGLQMFTNVDGQVTGSVSLGNLGVNVNVSQPSGVGLNGFGINNQVYGTIQYSNGFSHNTQFRTGAVVTNGVNALNDSTHQETGTTTNGIASFSAYPLFDSGSILAGGYTGVNVSPNIFGSMAGSGFNGVNVNGNIVSTANFISAFNNYLNVNSGSVISGSIQGYSSNSNIQSGVTVQGITDFSASSTLQTGSTVNYIQGYNSNIQVNGTVNNGVTLANLNVYGTATVPNLTGLNISLNQLASTTMKQGLNINDGNINVQGNYDTALYGASPGFIGINGIGGLFNIESGSPLVNTLAMLNAFGTSITARDDAGGDPYIGNLGIVDMSTANQMIVASGKTITAYNHLLLATSLPQGSAATPPMTDGGAITDYFCLRMPGLLSQGGTVAVTNYYLLHMTNFGGSSLATNAWGLYLEDSGLQHYIKTSLAIDTASFKVSNASVGFEIGGNTKALRLPNLTTTEELALTPLAGMTVFNTTTNLMEFYDGTSWVAAGGGGGGGANTTLSNLGVTAINAALIPDTTDTYDLGSSSFIWSTVHAHILGDGPSINLTGGTLRNSGFSTLLDFSGSTLDFNGKILSNAADPLIATDVATKNYVDGVIPGANIVVFKEVQPTNTDGGTFSSGAWRTRTLNTTQNPKAWASLSTNQITLDAGTYQIVGTAPAYSVQGHKAKLANITDATDAVIGSNAFCGAGSTCQTDSTLDGVFTIAASKTFEVQHYCGNTTTTIGFGVGLNFGVDEVYTQVTITKLA